MQINDRLQIHFKFICPEGCQGPVFHGLLVRNLLLYHLIVYISSFSILLDEVHRLIALIQDYGNLPRKLLMKGHADTKRKKGAHRFVKVLLKRMLQPCKLVFYCLFGQSSITDYHKLITAHTHDKLARKLVLEDPADKHQQFIAPGMSVHIVDQLKIIHIHIDTVYDIFLIQLFPDLVKASSVD